MLIVTEYSKKGEVVLVYAIMAYGGLEVWLHSFLTWAVD